MIESIYEFQTNKYTKWYLTIIERRKLTTPEGYSEKHHIIPKSLGGSNDKSNLVRLTGREHFICHLLLTRMTSGRDKHKMIAAAHNMIKMSKSGPHKIYARTYAVLREEYSKYISSITKGVKKKPHTEEHKAYLSAKMKGYDFGPEHAAKTIAVHTGRKRSEETKARIAAARGKQVMALKTWILQKPDGSIIRTQRLKEFCQQNSLGLSKLRETMDTKKPVEVGYSTGWMILGFELLRLNSSCA